MPKRRMTPARRLQIQRWAYAGRRIRSYGGIPTGKNTFVVHRTNFPDAANIVKTQRFKRSPFGDNYVYGGTLHGTLWEGHFGEYGHAAVGFKVPRKMVQSGGRTFYGANELRVHRKNVQGRRIVRVI